MNRFLFFLSNIFKSVLSSDYNRNIAKVFSGTLLAQVIAIGISPILTRIYTPEDFSNLALYLSVVSILSVFATLKYDKAIILPRYNKNALALVALSIFFTLLVGVTFIIIYFFCDEYIIRIFKIEGIKSWLIFVPITILARALYTILNTWFNREKKYAILSKNRVFTSSINGGMKIFLQLVTKLGAFGLVLSEAISQIVSLGLFGYRFFKENLLSLKKLNKKDLIESAKKYKSFPIYSLPADFLLIYSRELPVLILSFYFGAGTVGFYMLTKRVLDVPFTLLSTSILEVFKQKATEDFHNLGNCKELFIKTFKKLFLISIVPFSILFIISPSVFSFVFGSEWRVAGEYAQVLSVMYFFKFITSPLTFVFFIFNKQHINLILQIIAIVIFLLTFYFGITYYNSAYSALIIYSCIYSIIYIVYLIISYKISINYEKVITAK